MKTKMTAPRFGNSTHRSRRDRAIPRRRIQRGMCLTVFALTVTTVFIAPTAAADPSDTLRAALVAARGTSCGPLRNDPKVEQAAGAINGTTDKWINNAARVVPETNALAVLKDLGYGGSKATIYSGASVSGVDAIKATLLQGYLGIPDCSYTDYGVSALYNAKKGMILTTIVLAA